MKTFLLVFLMTFVMSVFSTVSASEIVEKDFKPWLPPPFTCHYEGKMLVCEPTGS